jgi:hypothetical protein
MAGPGLRQDTSISAVRVLLLRMSRAEQLQRELARVRDACRRQSAARKN